MESLFFGPSSSSLYGVYCPPQPVRERQEGIVLCYPFGQEYMRAHRAMRQLALSLADQGYHVLRFDYRGTGDSAGDMQDIELSSWVADAASAVTELRDMAAVSKVTLIGLRLGALVAALTASQGQDISRLILWDPVCDGASFLQSLRHDMPPPGTDAARSNFIDNNDTLHFNGFSLPATFQHSLQLASLAGLDITPIKSVLHLVSHETTANSALRQAWSQYACYQYCFESAPHDWNYVDNFGSILLPQPSLAAIRNWLE